MAVNLLAGESFGTAKDTVKNKLPNIMVTAWKFWPLVHCVTYGVIPARHRILWVNSVDLIWNAILATQTSQKDDDNDVDDGEEQLIDTSNADQVSSLSLELIEKSILDNQDAEVVVESNDELLLESTSVVLDNTDNIPFFVESEDDDDDLNDHLDELKDFVLESTTTPTPDTIFNDSKNSTINLCTSS